MELGEFDIYYRLQPSIKAQALANFLVECTLLEEIQAEAEVVTPILMGDVKTLHVYGVSNAGGSGVGMILASLDGIIVKQALHFNFKTSNNETKCEVLLAGLWLARELRVQYVKALSES